MEPLLGRVLLVTGGTRTLPSRIEVRPARTKPS
jgi:hypothetical protein